MSNARYFYRIGYFDINQDVDEYALKKNEIEELERKIYGNIPDVNIDTQMLQIRLLTSLKERLARYKPEIPKEFQHLGEDGYDVRTWTLSRYFNEIDKDMYDLICDDEYVILNCTNSKAANIKHWHHPISVIDDGGDISNIIGSMLGISDVIIDPRGDDKRNMLMETKLFKINHLNSI